MHTRNPHAVHSLVARTSTKVAAGAPAGLLEYLSEVFAVRGESMPIATRRPFCAGNSVTARVPREIRTQFGAGLGALLFKEAPVP